jgi:predicted RNase H-like nuclease
VKILAAIMTADTSTRGVLVRLGADGRIHEIRSLESAGALPSEVAALAGDEPFSLALDIPVAVPGDSGKTRKFETIVRRRLGHKLPAGGRAAAGSQSGRKWPAEALLAGLSTVGRPALSYPDRDRRRDGVAEVSPELALKALLWESSTALWGSGAGKDQIFRAFSTPAYRRHQAPKRSDWASRAVALDLAMRGLIGVDGFDLEPARRELSTATDDEQVEQAAILFDAALMAGTLRRYLETPQRSLFVGDRETGYIILPADEFIRGLALHDSRRAPTVELFPRASLKEQLGEHADLRSLDLLEFAGRPQRVEAQFKQPPVYSFENVDEMLWWKHCRHIDGPTLPTEGLEELKVALFLGETPPGNESVRHPLSLSRSRHKTLSFRFDAPGRWRETLSPRDGCTYKMQILKSVHRTSE